MKGWERKGVSTLPFGKILADAHIRLSEADCSSFSRTCHRVVLFLVRADHHWLQSADLHGTRSDSCYGHTQLLSNGAKFTCQLEPSVSL